MPRRRTRMLGLPVPPQIAHRATFDAIGDLCQDASKVWVENGVILADVKIGVRSWGERVTATVFPEGQMARVEVTSASSLPTQVFDNGKHNKNLDAVVESLSNRLRVPVTELDRS
ncbi:hypothetical protein ACMYYO_01395 [Dermacoccaceae bacterium W4C1]